jgi:hypothetical protein
MIFADFALSKRLEHAEMLCGSYMRVPESNGTWERTPALRRCTKLKFEKESQTRS